MAYTVNIYWHKADDAIFTDKQYDRTHTWRFDGGAEVVASSSPHVVRVPLSNEQAVDPEEALIAAAASCHMLWFLSIAAERNWVVEHYEDNASGVLGKNDDGRIAMSKISLRPRIVFANAHAPSAEQINEVHTQAHEKCFIANSLRTTIEIIIG